MFKIVSLSPARESFRTRKNGFVRERSIHDRADEVLPEGQVRGHRDCNHEALRRPHKACTT